MSDKNAQGTNNGNNKKEAAVSVRIDYCGSWGYGPKANQVKAMVLEQFPDAQVACNKIPGSTGSFEVYVNDKLVHSKLKGEGFVQDKQAFLQKLVAAVEA